MRFDQTPRGKDRAKLLREMQLENHPDKHMGSKEDIQLYTEVSKFINDILRAGNLKPWKPETAETASVDLRPGEGV